MMLDSLLLDWIVDPADPVDLFDIWCGARLYGDEALAARIAEDARRRKILPPQFTP